MLRLNVVGAFVCFFDPLRVGASVPGGFNHAGQVLGDRPDEVQHLALHFGVGQWFRHTNSRRRIVEALCVTERKEARYGNVRRLNSLESLRFLIFSYNETKIGRHQRAGNKCFYNS